MEYSVKVVTFPLMHPVWGYENLPDLCLIRNKISEITISSILARQGPLKLRVEGQDGSLFWEISI